MVREFHVRTRAKQNLILRFLVPVDHMLISIAFRTCGQSKPLRLFVGKERPFSVSIGIVPVFVAAELLQKSDFVPRRPLDERHSLKFFDLAAGHFIFEIPFDDRCGAAVKIYSDRKSVV